MSELQSTSQSSEIDLTAKITNQELVDASQEFFTRGNTVKTIGEVVMANRSSYAPSPGAAEHINLHEDLDD